MRTIRVRQFEGPLDLLLQLIEAQELDITTVALGEVTEQYLEALRKEIAIPAEELADFLVVAAKLLLIKSKLLLPGVETQDDEDGPGLEAQLRLYRRYVVAAKFIQRRYQQHLRLFPREDYGQFQPLFVPPDRVGVETLQALFRDVLQRIEPVLVLPKESVIRAMSLREKIHQIETLLKTQSLVNFHTLLARAKTRMEIIVTFLALLELVKQQSISVVQEDPFHDMEIHPSTSDASV